MDDDFLADSDVGMSDEDFSDYDDDDDENVALPSSRKGSKPSGAAAGSGAKVKSAAAKTSKKAPNNNNAGGKKKGLAQRNINMIGADDDDDDDDDAFPVVVKSSGDGRQKTIEEQYQKLEQHEHVLKRPDTYIGSTSPTEDEEMFIYDAGEDVIIKKKITYTPGLFKIFDESKLTVRCCLLAFTSHTFVHACMG
jgi:DNA topoisomerase-2